MMLTCNNGSRAVLLGVAILQADGASTRLRLVCTQRLPLLLQTIFVFQMVLHVRLRKLRRRKGETRCKSCTFVIIKERFGMFTAGFHFIQNHQCFSEAHA